MTPIAVVVGNPKPASRTLGAAVVAADALARATGAPASHLVVDLAEHAGCLFDWADPGLSRLTAEVAAADLAVFASPTYKASYTGMLKAFLDRYGAEGLAGTVAVPVMTGGWPGHLLAVEVHLRPVLVELGAVVPARGLYVTEPELGDLGAAVDRWASAAVPLIQTALGQQGLEPRSRGLRVRSWIRLLSLNCCQMMLTRAGNCHLVRQPESATRCGYRTVPARTGASEQPRSNHRRTKV